MTLSIAFIKHLRDNSLPVTKEREEIVDIIDEIDHHFTIDELLLKIVKRGNQISRATTYRTVQVLLDAGLLTRLTMKDKTALYENTYGKGAHNHMICIKCGKIMEFGNNEVEEKITLVTSKSSFQTISYSLKIYGRCSHCAKNKKEKDADWMD